MWVSDFITCMANPRSLEQQITVKFNLYDVWLIKVGTQLCLNFFYFDLEVSWLSPLSCCCADRPWLLNLVRQRVLLTCMINQQMYVYKYPQSHVVIILRQQPVAVTLVTTIRVSHNNNTVSAQIIVH